MVAEYANLCSTVTLPKVTGCPLMNSGANASPVDYWEKLNFLEFFHGDKMQIIKPNNATLSACRRRHRRLGREGLLAVQKNFSEIKVLKYNNTTQGGVRGSPVGL
jgi:hypothetical protein